MAKNPTFEMHRHFLNESEVKGKYLSADVNAFLSQYNVIQSHTDELVIEDGEGSEHTLFFDNQRRLKIGEWSKAHTISAGNCIIIVIAEKKVMLIDGSRSLDPQDAEFRSKRYTANIRLVKLDITELKFE